MISSFVIQKDYSTSSVKSGNYYHVNKRALLSSPNRPPFPLTTRLLQNYLIQKHLAKCGQFDRLLLAVDYRRFSTVPDEKGKPDSQGKIEKEDEGSLEVDRKLKILKEELEAGEREAERTAAEKKSVIEHKKMPLKTRVWNELVHYYHGFRLFFIDLKVSIRLLTQVLRGRTLSRAEKLQV